MKISVDDIEIGRFDVREDVPEDHIEELAKSMKNDGQLNAIVVVPGDDDKYEVVSGHSRLRAARKLGWGKIETQVKDISEVEADKLSLTSNMFRKGMSNYEQGQVLRKLLDKHDLTQKEVAQMVGKNPNWVRRRVKVALDVRDEVAEALENDKINLEAAYHIATLDNEDQMKLLNRLVEKDLNTAQEIRREKKWLSNDKIYTIGYSGKDFDQFVEELKNEDIDKVLDTRHSTNSQYKPQFNGEVLERQLSQEGIDYEHRKDLGVPYLMQTPYKDGFVSDECFSDWYNWHIKENNEIDVSELVEEVKSTGKVALLCMEKHAKPQGDQEHYCHRHFLANMLMEEGFGERKDL